VPALVVKQTQFALQVPQRLPEQPLKHPPLTQVNPAGQVVTHPPVEQHWPAPQTLQVPPVAQHTVPQAPLAHACPARQQALPQHCRPAGQQVVPQQALPAAQQTALPPVPQAATGHWQVPPAHTWPAGQAFPHPPQLALSVAVFTHVCPQAVCPLGQTQAQLPPTVWGGGQLFTQVPPHRVVPWGQAQVPAVVQ